MRVPWLAVALALPFTSGAQTVRGRTLSPDARVGVPGVLLLLVDAGGSVVGRTVSRDSGTFTLAAPVAGTFRVRALRIGFAPTVSDVLTLPRGGTRTIDLPLNSHLVTLSEVNITDAPRCSPTLDGGPSAFQPWDEARKALELASLSAAMPYEVEMARHERRRDARSGRVLSESAEVRRGMSLRPFVSRPPGELDSLGYVRSDGDSLTFHAPDAAVLLSPSFGSTHCFRRAPDKDGDIVIAFTPTPDRQRSDIAGTITLSSRDRALRRVNFNYVGLPRNVPAEGAGGFLEFEPIPSGDWIVRKWGINIPLYRRAGHRTGRIFESDVEGSELNALVADQYQDVSGEVLTIVYRGATLWSAPLPALTGVVRTDDGLGIARASVSLPMLDRHTSTDSLGRFLLDRVPSGRHELLISSPFMDSLGVHAKAFDVVAGAGDVALRFPSRDELFFEACDDPAVRSADYHGALLRGTVRGSDGHPMPKMTVTAEWFQAAGSPVAGGRLGEQRRLSTITDGHGRFSICGVSQYQRISLRAQVDSRTLGHADVFVNEGQRLVLLDLATTER